METSQLIKKNFEAQMWVDGKQVQLNHLMQEALGNILEGFFKALPGQTNGGEVFEVETKRLHQPVDVDAYTYS